MGQRLGSLWEGVRIVLCALILKYPSTNVTPAVENAESELLEREERVKQVEARLRLLER